jgi:hypothetical protein
MELKDLTELVHGETIIICAEPTSLRKECWMTTDGQSVPRRQCARRPVQDEVSNFLSSKAGQLG